MLNKNTAAIKKVNGVWLNGKHSYRDYGMFLSERPKIEAPEPRLILIDIPGADGELDATEAASGSIVRYKNRILTLPIAIEIEPAHQQEFKSRLLNDLHGKLVDVVLDEDCEWSYSGRAKVLFDNPKSWKLAVKISVDAYPYKIARKETVVDFSVAENSTSQEEELVYTSASSEGNVEEGWYESSYNYADFEDPTNPVYKDLTVYDYIKIEFASAAVIKKIVLRDRFGEKITYTSFPGTYTELSIVVGEYEYFDYSSLQSITIRVDINAAGGNETITGVLNFNKDVVVLNGEMSVVPTFSLSGVTSLIVNNGKVSVEISLSHLYDERIVLHSGENTLHLRSVNISGIANHTVSLSFRKGSL